MNAHLRVLNFIEYSGEPLLKYFSRKMAKGPGFHSCGTDVRNGLKLGEVK